MRKILFITPYFQRTGSELVLYNIISNLNKSKYEIGLVVTKAKGELIELLPEHIKTFIYTDYQANKQRLIETRNRQFFYRIFRLFYKLVYPSKIFPEEIKATYEDFFSIVNHQFNANVWYINTVLQPFVINIANKNKIPCIVHTHEMEQMYSLIKKEDFTNLLNIPKLIIACSQASANVFKISGRKDNIKICYPGIDLKTIKPDNSKILEIRQKLEIDKSAFIWVMSGMLDNNKNPVKFVDICHEIIRRGHNVHFIWIGGGSESGYSLFAQKKAEFLGLRNKITWAGKLTKNYYDYLNTGDGFLLTSTYDSFPLVMIENAYLGKPIVGFNSGGIREFINNEKIGKVVKTFRTNSIADIMINVMTNTQLYDSAIAKKRAEEFSISVQLPKWEKIIDNYI